MNTDYTNSAVNLITGDKATLQAERLLKLAELMALADKACKELDATPQAMDFKNINAAIALLKEGIKSDIDAIGSYQDLEHGFYAVKQKRVGFTYSPELVKANLPKYATALIEETVNSKALDGLVKGKLITQEQVASIVGETKETYAYIIKAEALNG